MADNIQDAANTANNQNQNEVTNLALDKGKPVPTPQTAFIFEDAEDNDTFALALAEGCVVDFSKAKLQKGYRVENGVKDPNPFPSVAAGGYRFPLKAVAGILQPEGNSKNDIEIALQLLGKRKLREYSRGEYDQNARKYTKPTVWSWSSEISE